MHNVDTIIGIIVQDVDVESVHNLINTIRTDNQFPSILFHNRLNSMLLQKADLSQAQGTFLLYIINLFDIHIHRYITIYEKCVPLSFNLGW